MFHRLDPAARDAPGIAVVKQRHHLGFEQPVQLLGIGRVDVLPRRRRGNSPAVAPIVTLGPPPVQRAELRYAVQCRLHAARAACLERRPRHIQPDIHALDQTVGEMHVVVLDERDPALEARLPRMGVHALEHLLPGLVARVGLAGEHDLHRAPGIHQQPLQPLGVPEDQVGPLVGREPPAKADREGVRIE